MMREPPKNNKISISIHRRNELKALTEEFLDRDWKDILARIENDKAYLRDITPTIVNILFPYRYYDDEVDDSDITDSDRERLLLGVHAQLKALWDKFVRVLFEYKNNVRLGFEVYHDIKIPKTKPPKDHGKIFNTITIKANFDAGKINLTRKDVDLVNNFIKFLEGTPIDIFSKCEKCDRVIIVTRSDRKCCSTLCAASLIQKKKWAADPDACKEKERERNRRRKEEKGE